jgi:hypothetical protein
LPLALFASAIGACVLGALLHSQACSALGVVAGIIALVSL